MIRFDLLVCVVAVTAVAACTVPGQQADTDAYKAPVYRTGSNLPAGRETGQSVQELTAAVRKTIEDLQNRPRQPIGVAR